MRVRRCDVPIVTDEQPQAGWTGEGPTRAVSPNVPVYTFNLAGYRYGHDPSGVGNRHTFGGRTFGGVQPVLSESLRADRVSRFTR